LRLSVVAIGLAAILAVVSRSVTRPSGASSFVERASRCYRLC